MLDFIFRRDNPTNQWQRSPVLSLTSSLDDPSLMEVRLGGRLDGLSALGRSDTPQAEELCYFDLGVGLECAQDGTLRGFTVVLSDEENRFRRYDGAVSWQRNPLDVHQLRREDLSSVFGEWYWLDSDDTESIAFYEFSGHEMQLELSPSGAIKRLILTQQRLMGDPEQREAYNVNKAWPPVNLT